MRIAKKLVATAVGTAAAAALALPAGAAGAATVTAGPADLAPAHHQHHRYTTTFWTIVRADDPDGRNSVNLHRGQWVKIEAVRGRADCNDNDNDNSDACVFDADGQDTAAPADWLAPGLDQFSLVGKVGEGHYKQLGTDRTKLTGRGTLNLAYNDLNGAYDDNRGGFLVKITKCVWGC